MELRPIKLLEYIPEVGLGSGISGQYYNSLILFSTTSPICVEFFIDRIFTWSIFKIEPVVLLVMLKPLVSL
jgi:hypothetical protein